jgi:hypothetical protein
MQRLQRRLVRQQAQAKNHVDRPARAAHPVVWRNNRLRRDYSDLASITPRRQSFTVPRAHLDTAMFPAAARIVCQPATPIIENVAALASGAQPLPMDDIDHAYGEDCAAIMREFAHRIAGARNQGERRAIKSARKSALASAKEKAKRKKAARKAQNAARRPAQAPPRPEARPA